jgi:hypothetical protein
MLILASEILQVLFQRKRRSKGARKKIRGIINF